MASKRAKQLSEQERFEILERVRLYRDMGQTGNTDLMSRMEKAEDFVTGRQQWDPAIRADMEDRGKVCITIPLIQPQIDQLVGYVVQNPKDIKIDNQRGGLKMLADLQSALIKHALTDQNVVQQVKQFAEQGMSTGASYLALFLDYDSDPKYANLEILRLNEFEVLEDPSCQVYDPSTPKVGARFIIWEPWVDRSYIEAKWPEELEAAGVMPGTNNGMIGFVNWLIGGVKNAVSNLFGREPVSTIIDVEKLRQPLTHCWWVEYKKVEYFYDLRNENEDMDGMMVTDDEERKLARAAVKEYPETFELREAVAPVINHTICNPGCNILFEHKVDELGLLTSGQSLYPVVPFHPHFNNGYKRGVGECMIGVQEYINQFRTVIVNALKNMPNSGWIIGGDMDGSAKWLEDHAGQDGIVIDRSKFNNFIEQIRPPNVPPLEQLTRAGIEELPLVSNIRTEEPQRDSKEQSGRLVFLKQQSSQTGVSPVYANLDYSLLMFGKLVASVIRAKPVYSDGEIKQIVEEKRLLDPALLDECRQAVATAMGFPMPQPPEPPDILVASQLDPTQVSKIKTQYERHLANYQQAIAAIDAKAKPMAMQALIDAMRNARKGRYNCRVSLAPESVTVRARNLMEIAEVNQLLITSGGRPLSEKVILEATDLPAKDQILAERGL